MTKAPGGPLVLGPPWDFNEAWGLCCGYPIEGYQNGVGGGWVGQQGCHPSPAVTMEAITHGNQLFLIQAAIPDRQCCMRRFPMHCTSWFGVRLDCSMNECERFVWEGVRSWGAA
jgi:hypothetical protein